MFNNVGCVCVASHICPPKVAPFFKGWKKNQIFQQKKIKILKYDL